MPQRSANPRRRRQGGGGAVGFLAVLALVGIAESAPTPATPPGEAQPAAWQHHHVKFSYVGFTTLYTCSGLESKVQAILEFLGARRGMTVYASGCMGGPDVPSRSAWVDAEFDSPEPAAAGAPDAVGGFWTPFQLNDRHPNFMGSGDCELIQSMKETVQQNLAARGLTYRTDCFPNEVHNGDFRISGEALKVTPPAAGQAAHR